MGNCTGMAKPANNSNAAKDPQKPDVMKPDMQTVMASKPENQNTLNVKKSNMQAAPQQNIQSQVKVPPAVESQPQKSSNQVVVAKQDRSALPPQQAALQRVKASKLGVAQQQPGKVPSVVKNSIVAEKQNKISWLNGSHTPVNQSMKRPEVIQQEAKVQNNQENIAVSWMNVSNTPSESRLNVSADNRQIERNQKQIKNSASLIDKNMPPGMNVIQEQKQPGRESSMSKPNSVNNSLNMAAPGSNEIKKEGTSIIVNNNDEQFDDLEQILSGEQKYGGISISEIKLSKLQSNIAGASKVSQEQKVQPTNQSRIEGQNTEFFSPPRQNTVNSSKVPNIKVTESKFVKKSNLELQQNIQFLESKIIEESKVRQSDESFNIEEPGELAQLEGMMIPDEGNLSPLLGISWKSQINIL